MDGEMDKRNGVSIHRMEYHAALKSKVILMCAATQMNLEDRLSEIIHL